MSDPSLDLQKAMVTALATVLAGSAPIYDGVVPKGAAYPYLVLDGDEVSPIDGLDDRRDQRFIYLSVYSDYPGQKEAKQIVGLIDTALHRQKLILDDGSTSQTTVTRTRITPDADGQTFTGSVTVKALTTRQ